MRYCIPIESYMPKWQSGAGAMKKISTLEYWVDDGWYVGKLREAPGMYSQGETLEELEINIEDAYRMMMQSGPEFDHPPSKTKEVMLEVS